MGILHIPSTHLSLFRYNKYIGNTPVETISCHSYSRIYSCTLHLDCTNHILSHNKQCKEVGCLTAIDFFRHNTAGVQDFKSEPKAAETSANDTVCVPFCNCR